ncbi:unnamed protein product [Colias eurytheme]|nr:unnamed protein product [Colias eurytheme]
MYRLISLAVLLTTVNGHWGPDSSEEASWEHHDHKPGGCSHHHDADFHFDVIGEEAIEGDESYQDYCKTSSNIAQEMYGQDGYILKYRLPGFDEKMITVRLKHRAVFVKAVKSTEVFEDVKLLSDILKVENAKWYLDGDFLVVSVPYKIVMGIETAVPCGNNINREIQNVAQVAAPVVDISSMYRSTNIGLSASDFSPSKYG